MKWIGFPIGFRFAAEEITEAFKKQAWEKVLSAAAYTELKDMTLSEAQLIDPVTGVNVYLPIINSLCVGTMQKNALKWRRDAALMGHLMFSRSLVQENYLEHYAETRLIGTFLPGGGIQAEEGITYLPERAEKRNFPRKKHKALFLSRFDDAENRNGIIAEPMEKLAAQEPSFEIRRVNFTEGRHALYYAAAFRNALMYGYAYKTEEGEGKEIPYALLPGGRCLVDGRGFEETHGQNISLTRFLLNVTAWYRKGADVLVDPEADTALPEGCTAIRRFTDFYALENAALGVEKLFCAAEDTAYFKDLTRMTLTEL